MKLLRFFRVLAFVLLLINSPVTAQNAEQVQNLVNTAQQQRLEAERLKEEALALAARLGLPVRFQTDDGQVAELMRFENGFPVYYVTHNAGGATLIRADRVYPGGGAGLNLTGSGQTLGVWDAGRVRLEHVEFGGRATQMDDASTNNYHATHVAGTMVAAGIDSDARGMSYEASLHAYDWFTHTAEMAEAALDGLKVSQHSYGAVTGWTFSDGKWYWFGDPDISETEDYLFGFYNNTARAWDEIAHNAPHYLIVKSAGNDRGRGPEPGTEHYVWVDGAWVSSTTVRDKDGGTDGYDCISTYGNAKNIMTVGAVTAAGAMTDFSAWGPTDDGRVKPDIVAKGVRVYSTLETADDAYGLMGGTSMSGPMVSGAVGLLLQQQEDLHPGIRLLSSTIKGLVLHSADDMIGGDPGPDYRFGWGLMDVEKSAGIMAADAPYGDLHIIEQTLVETGQFAIQVRATGSPLRATLAWTDPPGTPPVPALNPPDPMLVNDLDLRIADAASQEYAPYILDPANPSAPATTGDNFRDNVEMVHIENPVGEQIYTIYITHKGSLAGGSQDFSLIITGNEPTDGPANPLVLSALAAGKDAIQLEWTKNLDNDPVMLAWSPNGSFGIPENGTVYGAGQTIPGGGTVIYRGGADGFTHTGLDPLTAYYYKAYSYDASDKYSIGRTAHATTFLCDPITVLPFSENFDASAALPDCWQIIDHLGNGQVWEIGTHSGGLIETTGNYAFLNSDAHGQGNSQNSDLVTPVLDLSGYRDVILSFTHYFRQYEDWSTATLSYSIDGGGSWTQLQQWTTSTVNPSYFSQEIPGTGGEPAVLFKWNYTGSWGFYWDVDDITLDYSIVPETLDLADETITPGEETCFDAQQTITTGGDGPFIVEPGASVSLIAGQNILMLPGTHIMEGASLHAWITTDESFCGDPGKHLLAAEEADYGAEATPEQEATADADADADQPESTVSGTESIPDSFPGLSSDAYFRVYPNPTHGTFTLELIGYETGTVAVVEVIGLRGERILRKEIPADQAQHTIDLHGHPAGVYLLRLVRDGQTSVQRLIKR